MQGAAGEAAVRQVGIDRRQAEGQGFALLPHPGHEPAQLGHHGGAVARHGKGDWPGHGCVMAVQSPLDIHCMFWIKFIEQRRNNAKAGIVPGIILLADQWLAEWGRRTG
jgi:hypothetical protein